MVALMPKHTPSSHMHVLTSLVLLLIRCLGPNLVNKNPAPLLSPELLVLAASALLLEHASAALLLLELVVVVFVSDAIDDRV